MTTVIYSYFSDNFGHINSENNKKFEEKQTSSTKDLKKALKKLKQNNADVVEIKY